MGGEWRDVALGDLFKVKHGFAFNGEFFTNHQHSQILVTPPNLVEAFKTKNASTTVVLYQQITCCSLARSS